MGKSLPDSTPDNELDSATPPSLPAGYQPSLEEDYMSDQQLEYFRGLLLQWREDLLRESKETIGHLQSESFAEPDVLDRAALESNAGIELRTRDRYRKLIGKIDEALQRIDNKSYGYCQRTGSPIGLERLQARPVATLCVEAQEIHEREERA